MASMTYNSNAHRHNKSERQATRRAESDNRQDEIHLVIQILSVIAFGAVSIVAVSLAFSAFWVAGLLTTGLVTWTWAGSRMFGGKPRGRREHLRQRVSDVAPTILDGQPSGNANFDAYRSQMLESLEQESRDFEGFLTRLRDAEGKMEFDQYMDDRAEAAKETRTEIALLDSIDEKA